MKEATEKTLRGVMQSQKTTSNKLYAMADALRTGRTGPYFDWSKFVADLESESKILEAQAGWIHKAIDGDKGLEYKKD